MGRAQGAGCSALVLTGRGCVWRSTVCRAGWVQRPRVKSKAHLVPSKSDPEPERVRILSCGSKPVGQQEESQLSSLPKPRGHPSAGREAHGSDHGRGAPASLLTTTHPPRRERDQARKLLWR